MSEARRTVSCRLGLTVRMPALLALQVAVARLPGLAVEEHWQVTLDGAEVARDEVDLGRHETATVLRCGPGELVVAYRAEVAGRATTGAPVDQAELLRALRPSRYAPSDLLAAYAGQELGAATTPAEVVAAVDRLVHGRLRYVLGSSRGTDSALDSLLLGEGACRDFAHLAVALCRARDVPARLVAAYAPGLAPMDFHAVAEVWLEDRWVVLDTTRLAPRPGLLRIATGQDAADTAFLSTHHGEVELRELQVMATTEGDLPQDDHAGLVTLG